MRNAFGSEFMRNTTIVVALLAATVASANAAPGTDRLARGASQSVKTQQINQRSVADPAKSQRSANVQRAETVPRSARANAAAAFTSARNAVQEPAPTAAPAKPAQPQTRRAAAVAKVQPRAAVASQAPSRAKVARSAADEARRKSAGRRLAERSRAVSLNRTVEDPAAFAAPSAPAGSIPAMVTDMARKSGVSPALAHAVVKVESRYRPNATGPGGYIGLMQLSYQTAKGMGFRGSRKALYEPTANLTYGMRYLAGAVAKSGGNTCAAVSKYQGGHGVRGVTRAGAVYCAKVKRFMTEGAPSGTKLASN
jgi:soluble lytic murein transglycosylase-like protein